MNTTQQRLITRGQIIALREEGLPVRAITDQLDVSTSTVKRRPRPRLTTRDEDAAIIAAIQNNPLFDAVTIREALHLDERLAEQHRTGRLQFAQQYVGEEPEF
ncbi:putative Homeodomain-like domain-containing protein 14, partial [Homarus americanus]